MGKLYLQTSSGVFTRVATGSGSGGGGTTAMPLGYNFGVYVTYKDADEIYVQPGNIDVNGTDVSVTTATAHTMTSMVNASEDFHYIYLAAAGTITDATTEPAWSDAKFGWYSGDTRCIGAVWVSSATPAVVDEFFSDKDGNFHYKNNVKQILDNGSPTGLWIDLTADTYIPVNATHALVSGYNTHIGSFVVVAVSSYEAKSGANGVNTQGYSYAFGMDWVLLGATRNLAWTGENDDANTFDVIVRGYRVRV